MACTASESMLMLGRFDGGKGTGGQKAEVVFN